MGNSIGKEMLSKLQEIMRSKPNLISLCGIADDATEADLSGLGMDGDDASILASELPDKRALSVLSLKDNRLLTTEAGKILSDMVAANTVLKELDLSSNNWTNDYGETQGYGPGFAQELAVGIRDNGAISTVIVNTFPLPIQDIKSKAELDFSGKKLQVEDVIIIAALIPSNVSRTTFPHPCYH
jgi:hypothetical protein